MHCPFQLHHPTILPSFPSLQVAAAQRERRNTLLSSAAAVLVLLVLSVGILSQESGQPISSSSPDALGMPWDILALAQLSGASRRHQDRQQQQQRLADQEARVATWRDRQRSTVFQETVAEQARAAAAATSLSRRLGRAASALSAAAAADPFLEGDRARQGLSARTRGQPVHAPEGEAQEAALAAVADE